MSIHTPNTSSTNCDLLSLMSIPAVGLHVKLGNAACIAQEIPDLTARPLLSSRHPQVQNAAKFVFSNSKANFSNMLNCDRSLYITTDICLRIHQLMPLLHPTRHSDPTNSIHHVIASFCSQSFGYSRRSSLFQTRACS